MWIWIFTVLMQQKVENGLQPQKPVTIRLVKDLSLGGADAGDEALFSTTATLAIAESGVIYVADPGNHRVAVFGADGRYRSAFGGRGQGPGEFDEPVAIALDPDEHPVIFDTGRKRMMVFSAEGKFLREVSFDPIIQEIRQPVIFGNGNVAMVDMRLSGDWEILYRLSLFSPDMKPLQSFVEIAMPSMDFSRAAEPGFWADYLAHHFEIAAGGFPIVAALDSETMVWAKSDEYEGHLTRQDGTHVVKFSKEFKPRPFNDAARRMFFEGIWQAQAANPALTSQLSFAVFEKAVHRAETPPRLPPMSAVLPLGRGFAVLSNFNMAKRQGQLDLFDQGGHYLGSAPYQGNFYFMTGNATHLYAVGIDPDDYIAIERFRLVGI